MVKASWSGSFPNLCSGRWSLEVYGINMSHFIPDELRHSPMNTYGVYEEWHFTDDWDEVWESYDDGLECDEWIEKNKYWLDTITHDIAVQEAIFFAISNEDWRHGSCGGCI